MCRAFYVNINRKGKGKPYYKEIGSVGELKSVYADRGKIVDATMIAIDSNIVTDDDCLCNVDTSKLGNFLASIVLEEVPVEGTIVTEECAGNVIESMELGSIIGSDGKGSLGNYISNAIDGLKDITFSTSGLEITIGWAP